MKTIARKCIPKSKEGLLPLLGTYLEGETLEVYKTIVRNTGDYEDAREQLLTWFRRKHERTKMRPKISQKHEFIRTNLLRFMLYDWKVWQDELFQDAT